MAEILLTGATGFVGGHLAEALARRGHSLRCVVRPRAKTAFLDALGAEIVRAELDDAAAIRGALRGVDMVYHVAGAVGERRRGEMRRVNGDLTAAFAQVCSAVENPPTFVHVSSVAAAGPTAWGTVRRVEDLPAPISGYGRSKLAGEKAVAALAGRMPITIVRPGVVLGPRDRASVAIFKTIRFWRMHPILGFRTPPLSLIHVADLVEILMRAAERGQRLSADSHNGNAHRGVYFACLEDYPTYAELGRRVRRMLNRPFAPVMPFPRPLAWCVVLPNQGLTRLGLGVPLLTLDKLREAAAPSWACSPAEAKRDLDFSPPLSLDDRLRETIAWYREARWI